MSNRADRRRALRLGPTGEFPRGKFNADDEGELVFRIGVQDKTVLLDFGGKPVTWIGMAAETAEQLANELLRRVREIQSFARIALSQKEK